MPDSNTTRARKKAERDDSRAIFDRTIATFVQSLCASVSKTANYDKGAPTSQTRSPGSAVSHFICDVELMLKRTLKTTEHRVEFDRLLDLAFAEESDKNRTTAERALTNAVVGLIAKAAHRRGLDQPNYWRTIKKRAA
jgi:hypothetical protein